VYLDPDKIQEAMLAFVPVRLNERHHCANLVVHGAWGGVLDYRSLSIRFRIKSAPVSEPFQFVRPIPSILSPFL
jgi:hypothetical protein